MPPIPMALIPRGFYQGEALALEIKLKELEVLHRKDNSLAHFHREAKRGNSPGGKIQHPFLTPENQEEVTPSRAPCKTLTNFFRANNPPPQNPPPL